MSGLRKALLVLGTLVVLIGVYAAYLTLGSGGRSFEPTGPERLPQASKSEVPPLQVGSDITVPGGGKMQIRLFNERTGQPTDVFACENWEPLPDRPNEIRVQGPELTLRLPTGMIATVVGDEGLLIVERIERSQMKPKTGTLTGHVRITIDLETSEPRTPLAERPGDDITITMSEVEFDLERGSLRTDDRLTATSDLFEIAGTGLDLVWNQADNQVERLTVAQGEAFTLYGVQPGLLGGTLTEKAEPAPATAPAPDAARPARRRLRGAAAYECTLRDGVVAEQYAVGPNGEDVLYGSLHADEIKLLFDLASRVQRFADPSRGATTQPGGRLRRGAGGRLVVHWNGPLTFAPAALAPRSARGRLHFTAIGSPVVLTRKQQGEVRCRQVAYDDATQRIWLEPLPGEQVSFAVGRNLSAVAGGVYVDQAAGVVKLLGPVELRSLRGPTAPTPGAPPTLLGGNRTSTIRCAYWATLHLAAAPKTAETQPSAATSRPAADPLAGFDDLESATFVGDVDVDLGAQRVRGHQLDVRFAADTAEGAPLEERFEQATVSGGVQLDTSDARLTSAWLDLHFARTPAGALYPQNLHAVGNARLTQGRAFAAGEQLTADMVATTEPAEGDPLFALRSVELLGDAELRNPQQRAAARGHRITASFTGANELVQAEVTGPTDRPGAVYRAPYTVYGQNVVLDNTARVLEVRGPSRLLLKTRASLEGRQRSSAERLTVTAQQLLRVDLPADQVRFEGSVRAATGNERLEAQKLTLTLADAPPTPQTVRQEWVYHRLLRGVLRAVAQTQQTLAGATPHAPRDPLAISAGPGNLPPKTLLRLVAEEALFTREARQPGASEPFMHASISAPHLQVEIPQRQIITVGVTEMLLTDRRPAQPDSAAQQATGVPAALLSKGASQTAMRCTGRMIYSLGPDGPQRRDSVIFEKGVYFVHRAGNEVLDATGTSATPVAATPNGTSAAKGRIATLGCERLEVWLATPEGPKAAAVAAAAASPMGMPMQLASLIASDNVTLTDEEGPRQRDVRAAWLSFDRQQGFIHVRGTPGADAWVSFADRSLNRPADEHFAREMTINLKDGTLSGTGMTGRINRQ